MKKIEAYIQHHTLDEVVLTLQDIDGLPGMSVADIRGFGRGKPDGERFLRKNVKVEVFCTDSMAGAVVSAIERVAHTGLRSDGKIYVSSVEDAVRISAHERGDEAV